MENTKCRNILEHVMYLNNASISFCSCNFFSFSSFLAFWLFSGWFPPDFTCFSTCAMNFWFLPPFLFFKPNVLSCRNVRMKNGKLSQIQIKTLKLFEIHQNWIEIKQRLLWISLLCIECKNSELAVFQWKMSLSSIITSITFSFFLISVFLLAPELVFFGGTLLIEH